MHCQNATSHLQLSRRCIKFSGFVVLIAAIALSSMGGGDRASAEVIPESAENSFRAWTDNRCGSCHKIDPLFSHPIDVVPTMSIPAHLPLDGGRMTCLTCHESDAESHAGARTDRSPLLRGSRTGGAFCAQCHTRTDQSRSAQHPLALRRAHLNRRSMPEAGVALGRFDSETNTCVSCHDGLMATDAGVSFTRSANALPGEHPIGVSMRQTHPNASADEALRSPTLLDRRIRLFNDNVGCGSCHSPFSGEKSLLVMSNQGSQLCLSCHMP